jgi:two-component system nitrogen regulation response regulator NtrX
MTADILIVDDEKDIRELVSDVLIDEGYTTRTAQDSQQALLAVEERLPAVVILDIWLQGSQLDGIGILELIRKKHPEIPVVMISGHGNIETAINAIKLGAYDYIEKPFKESKLLHIVKRAIETAKLRRENTELKQRGLPETDLIGVSSAITQLRNAIEKVAPTLSRVLISGPAGSGKEVVARTIHLRSNRAQGPLVVLSSANLALQSQAEAELLGVEDASLFVDRERKIGVFERAHTGTLLIDEVADLSLPLQSKLLRFLQESSFERIGGSRPIRVDVRVIATTNKDIPQLVTAGKFREDLYYRLNVVPLRVPSLRERREDISHLTTHFLKRSALLLGTRNRVLADDTLATMEAYSWPGNVRQLRNVIEWLLIMAPDQDEPISANVLPPELLSDSAALVRPDSNPNVMALPLRGARELFERQYLIAQIDRFSGNISRTASFVGMERSALHRKLKSLNIHGEHESE